MKKLVWLALTLACGVALLARADDDGVNIGRSIDLIERNKVDFPLIKPPAPAPTPRPVTMATAASHSGNVRLLKQMPAELTLGQEFMYQLQVIANENVADVIVRDVVPEGATYVRSEPPAQVSGRDLTWKFAEMDAGQHKDIKVWLKPDREGRIGSCATVFALSRACAYGVVGKPSVALTKTGPATATLGADIAYTITVSNPGSAIARGVVVTDKIPEGLAHASGQSALTFNVGDLAPGQSRTLPVVLKGTKRGRHCNTASAASANAGTANAEACTTILVPGVELVKSGTKEQFLGKAADYTVTVSNTGDTKLTNLVITDTAPAATRIVSASDAAVNGNQAVWRLAELAPGEKKTFHLTLTSATAGTHSNVAAVTSAEGQRANAEAGTLWRGVGAILVEVVDDPDPILVGNLTTYTVRITNQGSADLVNINTIAVFPANIAPVATQQGTVTGQNVKFQTVPRLPSKGVVEFKLTARGVSAGDTRVKFTFTEEGLSSPIVEEESTRVF
ncbi:MAG: hypothetical protein FD161_4641 [Limisphaerales bacterium]|nr:MAG: hypothetical protein FD161_4641 [Limisphaerales bacterium]KAG0506736.1 MAG: hypothetical protein E1N63_4082 [Limisphaerales bacterium]TXT46048.1 MAG: hypothetical protein FD140_4583 [Limisphaerales bacterium]